MRRLAPSSTGEYMAISKSFLKTRPSCKVKFQLTPEDYGAASAVYLVGDFNDWNEDSHPMKKKRDGVFYLEVELPLGRDYQFRYRTDTNVWLNDADADALVPSEFSGEENFLVKS
jgi:1,4-alpha-glucan branching enzyme